MKSFTIAAVFLLMGLATACTGQTEPVVGVETVVVEKQIAVVETVEAETFPIDIATAEPPENKIVYALDRDPEILNPYLFNRMAAGEAYRLVGEGLLGINPDGNYFPLLAKTVPSIQNGLVSADGLTVTYPLKEGVLWSDGMPFGCDDVRFTWQAVTHPESGAVNTAGYDHIANIECPDALTAVIKFSRFYAPYLALFSSGGNHGVLPQHATGLPAEMQQWSYNWFSTGTGPFKLQEWVPGDHLTFVPNEYYHGDKPGVDALEIRIIPDRQTAFNLLQSGEIGVLGDVSEGDASKFVNESDIAIHMKPGPGIEWLILNLANPELDATDDPANNPHWALGDARVRRAIQHAIDRDVINQVVFSGLTQGGDTDPLKYDWFDSLPGEYNPDKATSLLAEAGWIDQNSDGVRECHNCLYAQAGRPLRLTLHTTLGDALRRDTARQIQQMLKAVGIEVIIEYVPPAVLFGPWYSGAFRTHGKFDMLMYTVDDALNLQSQLEQYFHKSSLPTAANGGSGANYSRWVNDEFSHLLDQAGATPNGEKRAILYAQAVDILSREVPSIYLYRRNTIYLTRRRLQGFEVNPWANQTWNAAGWTISNQ